MFNEYEREVTVKLEKVELKGLLAIPPNAKGIIVFAHGSGSGRLSPRNQFVARTLQKSQFATLLLDLLTEQEEINREYVFNIPLLAQRLTQTKQWVGMQSHLKGLKIGFFGASTGAGAALMAAGKDSNNVFAVVSRGGRPDLAGEWLMSVKAPTLLLVGGKDETVIDLNEAALSHLKCIHAFTLIAGATHLFEEPGTLEQVASFAADWFEKYQEHIIQSDTV